MHVKDIPNLKQKVLDMLPITQSDVCKNLNIDHRDGSKLISIMIGDNLIKRTKSDRTFLLERMNGNGREESEKINLEDKKIEKEKFEKKKPGDTEESDKPGEPKESDKPGDTEESDKPGEAKNKVKYDDPVIKQKVLDMLPAIQSDIWKNLEIDRRSGSRMIGKMVKEGLVKRTKSDNTFLIEKLDGDGKDKEVKDEKSKYSFLLSNSGKFSPCCNCERECNPTICTLLTEWLL